MQITLKSSVSTVMTYPYRVSCLSIVALTPNQPITSVLLLLPFLRADIVVVGVTAGRIERERENEGASFVFCLSSPFSPLRWPDDPPTNRGRESEREKGLSVFYPRAQSRIDAGSYPCFGGKGRTSSKVSNSCSQHIECKFDMRRKFQ